jgi:hypothetical protein
VTEFATFNIAVSADTATKSKLEDDMLALAQFVTARDCKGACVGWGIEELSPEEGGGGGATTPMQLLVGWDSVEQHMKAREHADFAGVVGPIRAAVQGPPRSDMAVFHVKLRGKGGW